MFVVDRHLNISQLSTCVRVRKLWCVNIWGLRKRDDVAFLCRNDEPISSKLRARHCYYLVAACCFSSAENTGKRRFSHAQYFSTFHEVLTKIKKRLENWNLTTKYPKQTQAAFKCGDKNSKSGLLLKTTSNGLIFYKTPEKISRTSTLLVCQG